GPCPRSDRPYAAGPGGETHPRQPGSHDRSGTPGEAKPAPSPEVTAPATRPASTGSSGGENPNERQFPPVQIAQWEDWARCSSTRRDAWNSWRNMCPWTDVLA